MAKNKTTETNSSVAAYVKTIKDEKRRKDFSSIIELISKHTGLEPKMWGTAIVGFGSYHYKSDKSRQEGDWMLVGFSPRKAAISLYVLNMGQESAFLNDLGKFKAGVGCIYIKKLSDINQDVLKNLIQETIHFLQSKYGKN